MILFQKVKNALNLLKFAETAHADIVAVSVLYRFQIPIEERINRIRIAEYIRVHGKVTGKKTRRRAHQGEDACSTSKHDIDFVNDVMIMMDIWSRAIVLQRNCTRCVIVLQRK